MPDMQLYISTEDGVFAGTLNGDARDVKPIGLKGLGRVWQIEVDRTNPDRLYAATNMGGFYRSDDGGKTWTEKNRGILYKQAWSIAQHPSSGELFVGTEPTSVFKSSDGGETWTDCPGVRGLPESIDWTFPGPPHVAHIKGLGLSPHDPQCIYGAVEEGWLIRSTDGGKTWKTIKSGTEFDAHTVVMMGDDKNIVLSTSGTGVYRSEDGGETFVAANEGLTRRYVSQIVYHPDRPNELFTAASEVPPSRWGRPEGANAKFFRSDDKGRTWKELSGGLPDHIKPAPRSTSGDPSSPGTFLVGMLDGSVWMTRDAGESFKQIITGLPAVYGLTVTAQ